ncbi:hypothetical protein F4861DRAFT_284205 [Xylaria intraflava]|nr:hypothetical protein F4861DRAFT_284205 [Xylaria intraflava]
MFLGRGGHSVTELFHLSAVNWAPAPGPCLVIRESIGPVRPVPLLTAGHITNRWSRSLRRPTHNKLQLIHPRFVACLSQYLHTMEGRFQPSGDGFYPGRQYYAGDRSRSYNTNPGDASYYYSPLKRKRSITPPPKPQLVTRGFDSILHTFMARTERVGKDDRTSISNLTAPNLNVPALNTPNLNVPTLNAPNLNLPALNASNLNLPALNTPNLNRPVFNAPILNGPAISRPSKRTQASQQQEIRIPALSKKPAASCGRRAPPKAHGESGLMHFLPENIATDDELLQQKVTELVR